MNFAKSLLLTGLLLSSPALKAQTHYRQIAAPGTTIGGHTFTKDTTIDSVALNESGEVAFVARWNENGTERAGVFTSTRIVARERETHAGKYLVLIWRDTPVAINAAGQVAYEGGFFTDEVDTGGSGFPEFKILVEDRPAAIPQFYPSGNKIDFKLTEDGRIVFPNSAKPAPIETPEPKKKSLKDRIKVALPKPQIGPVSIDTAANATPVAEAVERPKIILFSPIPLTAMNAKGRAVIAANLTPSGFIILLSDPR